MVHVELVGFNVIGLNFVGENSVWLNRARLEKSASSVFHSTFLKEVEELVPKGVSNVAFHKRNNVVAHLYIEEVSRVAREAKLRLENLDEAGTVKV